MRPALAFALSLVLAACGAATNAAPPTPAPQPSAGGASDRLTSSLLDRLGPDDGNQVFSPYSVSRALAMVDQGAAGETAAQINRLLGADQATLASSQRALRAGLGKDAAQLKVADAVWVQSALVLQARFTQTLADDFGAPPRTVDFAADASAAAQAINAWAAARTGNLIRDLMPPDSIDQFTKLVLADAIYLKARWQYPFTHSDTHPGSFFTAAGRPVTAQFMSRQAAGLRYAAGGPYRAVELPYRGSSLSMLVIMPATGTLSRFEQHVDLAAVESSLRLRVVALSMPRFHLTAHTRLNGVLAQLGMPLAFSRQADFSGITRKARLQIQAVEHGADLKVDEAGTVAAAATGISIRPTVALPTGTQLVLDHPFLAFIRDRRTGAILFAARVMDPTRSG